MGIPFAPFLALGSVVALFAGAARSCTRYLTTLLGGRSAGVKAPAADADTSFEGYGARRAQPAREPTDGEQPPVGAAGALGAAFGVNESAELIADLIGSTGLVPADRLALVRGRAGAGLVLARRSSTRASRRARASRAMLAARHRLPLVDLRLTGVSDATRAADPAARAPARRRVAVPRSTTTSSTSRSPTRRTCTRSTSCGSRRATSSRSASRRATRSSTELERLGRVSEAVGRSLEDDAGGRGDPASRRPRGGRRRLGGARSSGSSTRSSSRPPRTAPATSTSRRRRTGSSSASAIDGVLQEVQRIPRRLAPGVTTRLKVLAKLDIAERRRPQDGRISLRAAAAGRLLDIRVATLPTVAGETVVMRLLDKSKSAPTLEALGLSDEMQREARRHHRPADRRDPRHRADRLRQVDHALRRADADQPARDQHHHRRGSGRVPARRA